MRLSDLNLRSIGNTIQISGVIYEGEGKRLLVPLPGEDFDPENKQTVLEMTLDDWQTFLRQTDSMEVETFARAADGKITKAIMRKSERQINASISWTVFFRDKFRCRYCGLGEGTPLTVDHLVCWEVGGPTTVDNLVSSCKKCNKTRGNMPYEEWIHSKYYRKVSKNLPEEVKRDNELLVLALPNIQLVTNIKTR